MLKEKVIIENELGLHARPAAKLAEVARRFKARVYLKKGSRTAEASSILDVLTLACQKGSTVEIWAEGEEAERALKEIITLLRSKAP
ncbi:HPr family phosphocarrier protein [Thermodesulfatator autotrophicus]|uniref:HPr domain-containing protein n=1 Tax=Thermodesulfatator autotrophicus TaxID=1795632 RepID=A0A177EAT0_9BACT|nr:HPr family phosphocarrier protein [Thermodesulfatator autotrophicus]OAG28119.1 hypothetical protein TH606_03545 [Thermodesulfatator autotrophicus]